MNILTNLGLHPQMGHTHKWAAGFGGKQIQIASRPPPGPGRGLRIGVVAGTKSAGRVGEAVWPPFLFDNERMHDNNWEDYFRYENPVINPKGMQACTWMDPSLKVRPRDPPVDPGGAIGGARNQPFWGTRNGCENRM